MKKIKILDHGYLGLVEHWGSDKRIVEAARMSTSKGFLGWDPGRCPTCKGKGETKRKKICLSCDGKGQIRGDKLLLKYLYENWHDTPFEMAGMVIEVQAPIMAFREWQRHRTQGYNEMSARYVPLPDINYVPTWERCMAVNGANKQANTSGPGVLTHDAALMWLKELQDTYDHCQRTYQLGLDIGIPKEIARLPVPVGRYSRMRATAVLRNWLAFLTLRSDVVLSGSKAQWELRQFANGVADNVQRKFPRTYDLFVAGRGGR